MNSVCMIGNLTRDPERRETRSETTIVSLRLAVNGRNDKVGYFDVTVFGKLADLCLEYLAKGRKVAVSGRLDYQEWKTPQGIRRSKVEVIASEVDFLPSAAPRAESEEPQAEAPEADAAPDDDTAPKSAGRKAKDKEPVAA